VLPRSVSGEEAVGELRSWETAGGASSDGGEGGWSKEGDDDGQGGDQEILRHTKQAARQAASFPTSLSLLFCSALFIGESFAREREGMRCACLPPDISAAGLRSPASSGIERMRPCLVRENI
jgi:hypothetical protein